MRRTCNLCAAPSLMRKLLLLLLCTGHHNAAVDGFFTPLRSAATRTGDISSWTYQKVTTWRGGSDVSSSSLPLISLGGMISTRTPISLPTCSTDNVIKVIAGSGMATLLTQVVLSRFVFARSKDPVISRNAAYTAHTVVAFLLMILVSYIGVIGWWWNPCAMDSAAGRLLVQSDVSRWLCSCILGAFLFWDIPTSIYVPALRKIDVVIHHIVMAVVATVSISKLPAHYALYYFGVSELSSVPLLLYDQLEQNCKILLTDQHSTEDKSARMERVTKQRDAFKVIAAVMFTLVRAVSFTKVTFCNYLPDCWAALPTAKRMGLGGSLRFVMITCAGFAALQLYWFYSNILRVLLNGGAESHET